MEYPDDCSTEYSIDPEGGIYAPPLKRNYRFEKYSDFIHSTEWALLREKAFAQSEGWCERHLLNTGIKVRAVMVHHADYENFRTNLHPLCAKCHAYIHCEDAPFDKDPAPPTHYGTFYNEEIIDPNWDEKYPMREDFCSDHCAYGGSDNGSTFCIREACEKWTVAHKGLSWEEIEHLFY